MKIFLIVDLGDVYLYREGYNSFLGLSQEIRVQKGDDVTLKCSASCSEEPNYCWYKEVSLEPCSFIFLMNFFLKFVLVILVPGAKKTPSKTKHQNG